MGSPDKLAIMLSDYMYREDREETFRSPQGWAACSGEERRGAGGLSEIGQGFRQRILVYNLLGQVVATLVEKNIAAGDHILRWDGAADNGSKVARGVYFVRMRAGDFVGMRKVVVVR